MALNFANNNSLSAITAKPSGLSGGAMNLISTQTASGSSTISFTSGIDSTYDEYVFKFINIHPATDNTKLTFNGSIDGGSNYNVVKTTTFFQSFNLENNSNSGLTYRTGDDLAQSTNFQKIITDIGNENDENGSGYLQIFNPSSETFVKHFIANGSTVLASPGNSNRFCAGYGNTTSSIDAIKFQMDSGNIDAGEILLFGVN